jgi:hypothetical protein
MPNTQRYPELVVYDETVIAAALRALETSAGIGGRLLPLEGDGHAWQPDACLELWVNEQRHRYWVECKRSADRRQVLAQAKSQLENKAQPGLLIAPHVTPGMAEHCRQLGLQFLDTAGNAYLRGDGLYVYIVGRKPETRLQGREGSLSPAALRMTFALLCHPELASAPYRDIVKAAGISLGTVGKIFDQLQSRGFVTGADRRHGRRLLEHRRLLDEWAALYPSLLRPRLGSRRFRAPDPLWWTTFQPPQDHAWWGGEIAAERLTSYLKPSTQTLYIAPASLSGFTRNMVQTYRLRPDPEGPIELLESFWQFSTPAPRTDLVPPELVYADLLSSLDPRCLEVARMIRKEVISDAHNKI